MKNLLCPLCLLIVAVCLSACMGTAGRTGTEAVLSQAASVMEERPDSALAILDTLDRSRLCSRKLVARHSLLYSQALEKNDILLETDSVITPAVKYFMRHGSPDEKLLTQYYLGCIRWNAGDLDKALDCFLRAERYAGKAKDYQAVGRLYSAMKSIYYDSYQFRRSLDCSLNAADYYGMSKDTALRVKALTAAANAAYQLSDNNMVDSLLYLEYSTLWSAMDQEQKSGYYAVLLIRNLDSVYNLEKYIGRYLQDVPEQKYVEWGIVSNAYFELGDIDSAKWALKNYLLVFPSYELSLQYLLMQYRIFKVEGKYKEALDALELYQDLYSEKNRILRDQDIKYAEDRFKKEINNIRHKYESVFACMCVLVLISIFVSLLSVYKKRLRNRDEELLIMHRKLKDALMVNAVDEDSRQKIGNMLSTMLLISSEQDLESGISNENVHRLKEFLTDKKGLLSLMCFSYSSTHPKFVLKLREHGLTDIEIGYCCLYAAGLNGKEISWILSNGGHGHYNFAVSIRSKLSMEHSHTHLRLYIKRLLEDIETETNEK